MRGALIDQAQTVDDITPELLDAHFASGSFFWLDLERPSDAELDDLGRRLELHPLAIADSREFDQRPKIDLYDGYALIVGYGLSADGSPVEIHLYFSGRWLVTIRDGELPAVEQLRSVPAVRSWLDDPIHLLYRIADARLETFPAVVDSIDDRIGELEHDILRDAKPGHFKELSHLQQQIADLKRTAAPSRDSRGARTAAIEQLPHMNDDGLRYLRDLDDEFASLGADLEALSERVQAVLALHLNLTGNRQNEVMRQLALVATIFLPLSFFGGFFGQNFATLNDWQSSVSAFFVAGIMVPAAAMLVVLRWMRGNRLL